MAEIVSEPNDFVRVLEVLTNFIENERIRAYNEGVDTERARCAKIAAERTMEKALRQIIKYTRECSDPDGWLAFNVRFEAEQAFAVSKLTVACGEIDGVRLHGTTERGAAMPAQQTEFDTMMQRFTSRVRFAADWKDNYFGAAYSSRIKQAIYDLESAIAEAKLNPEIKAE